MQPCCGLSNLTATIIIGILQIILCSFLCAAYAMGLAFLVRGKEQMLLQLDSEAGKDFVASLGLDGSSERTVFILVVLNVILYSSKIIFAIQLLSSIQLDSRKGIIIWLILEVTTFLCRLALFITSIVILKKSTTTTIGTIIIYTFSIVMEAFCIWVVCRLIIDMGKPSWKAKSSSSPYPEGFRIHSRRIYQKANTRIDYNPPGRRNTTRCTLY